MKVQSLLWIFCLVLSPLYADEGAKESLVENNLDFGINLYNTISSTTNPCISPYSITSALFVPYAGAKGETKDQMAATLKFALPAPLLANAYSELNRKLTYHPSNYPESFRINIANSLWVQNSERILPSFLKIVQHELGATVRSTDFIKQTEASRDKINDWVSHATNAKITDLLSEGTITSGTRMVVVSALYLKGEWLSPFNVQNTHLDTFFPTKSETKTLSMMNQTESLPYFENESVQAVELAVESPSPDAPKLALTVMLPKNGDEVTSEMLNQVFDGMKQERVNLTIPKFQMRSRMSVKESLAKLGMEKAFTADADFTGIMEKSGLTISDVIHETYLNVAEAGIEAAAATAVVMMKTSLPIGEPKVFKADKPFFFVLRDTKSGIALFLGRYDGS